MANFLVFLGGIIGLISGLVALFVFQTSILIAIVIWSVVGLVLTIGILVWILRPKAEAPVSTADSHGPSSLFRRLS